MEPHSGQDSDGDLASQPTNTCHAVAVSLLLASRVQWVKPHLSMKQAWPKLSVRTDHFGMS